MKKFLKILTILMIIGFISVIGIIIYMHYLKTDVVPIITYHNVVDVIEDDPNTTVNISTKKFEKQIKWLSKHGYKTISMDDLYEWKVNNKKIPRKSIIITFDDGWKSYYEKAVPILEKYNMQSNVFVVFKYTKNCTELNDNTYMNFDDLDELISNHPKTQILSHSYNLHEKDKADSGDYQLYDEDIKEVKKLGYNIKYYAYPFGHRNENYIKALKDNNYQLAFTFGPYDYVTKESNNYELPRLGIFESTNEWKFKLKIFLEI